MAIISSVGTKGWLVASNSFPGGFEIANFSDDQDSITVEEMEISGEAITPMGEAIFWDKPALYKVKMSFIPGSTTDNFMSGLFIANVSGFGKLSAKDDITLTLTVPGFVPSVFSLGKIMKGTPSYGASSDGRVMTKTYSFSFNTYIGA